MKRWQWAVRLLTRRMWFRAALFCLFAVGLALAGALIGHAVPYSFATKVGAKSVDNILGLLASSMLTVTTFSLATMVSAYAGATSNITPRAVQLLIDDPAAQNALATFLGAFLFAIVGIIALSTGLYGETGRVILYAGTIVVIVLIVVTLVRWIEYVARFGRVSDSIERVERAAMAAVREMTERPRSGPGAIATFPEDATVVRHDGIGRITHVDLVEIAAVAAEIGARITVASLPGALTDPVRVLAWTKGRLDPRQTRRVAGAFTIATQRAFDHDPRFGLVVLAEIAARALSPAVNDPGTAIAVIEAGTRVLAAMLRHDPDPSRLPADVDVAPVMLADLIGDFYRPIERYGAGSTEVAIRLQKSLATLAAVEPQIEADCRAEAAAAFSRSRAELSNDSDRRDLSDVHHRCWDAVRV